MVYVGDPSAVPHLNDGDYVSKTESGSSSKGVVNISIKDSDVIIDGVSFDHALISHQLSKIYGEAKIVIEKKIDTRKYGRVLDFKAYCFYGSGVDHVLCISRDPAKFHVSFSPYGDEIATGKYHGEFADIEISPQDINKISSYASKLCKNIPLSFVRLDFYFDGKEILIGEITPLPGQAWQFSREYDNKLGKLWLDAEKSLFNSIDSIEGAKFFYQNRIKFY